MFRTLVIEEGERLTLSHNSVHVEKQGEKIPLPVEDLYCIVLDNQRVMLSAAVITALTRAGAHVVICDERHMPSSVVYPEAVHYRPFTVVQRQISMPQGQKDALWDSIVRAKLLNQAMVLECAGSTGVSRRLRELAGEVEEGDAGNREGIGAKMYFRALFGSGFIRTCDSGVNSALNYGYAILRSSVVKSLYLFGFYPPLGIHHIGPENPFNLGDDLMEPFRPVIDLWTDLHHEELIDELTSQQRRSLVNLLNLELTYGKARMKLRNVISRCVRSFTSAVEKKDPGLFAPLLLTKQIQKEMEGQCHGL